MMKPFGDMNLRRRVHNAWHVVACVCELAHQHDGGATSRTRSRSRIRTRKLFRLQKHFTGVLTSAK